jgi:hypothetical protein
MSDAAGAIATGLVAANRILASQGVLDGWSRSVRPGDPTTTCVAFSRGALVTAERGDALWRLAQSARRIDRKAVVRAVIWRGYGTPGRRRDRAQPFPDGRPLRLRAGSAAPPAP